MSASASPGDTIPCLILTHGRDDICRESLASIVESDPRFVVDVVHNPSSEEDGSFLRGVKDKVSAGVVRSLTIFDANISNNAVLLYLLANRNQYERDYVVLTDGDIVAPAGLIDEQIGILEKHSDVFACGLRLDASLWDESLPAKKEMLARFDTSRFATEDYLNTATGLWMTMFRGRELFAIVDAMMDNGIRFTDGNLKLFGSLLFQKNWVATKRSTGRELNRERIDYHDRKAISTSHFGDHSPEPTGSNYATWNHDLVAEATTWTAVDEVRQDFPALPPALARYRGPLQHDPLVKQIASGAIKRPSAYVVKAAIRAIQPGLALVLTEGKRQSGISVLPGDRSVLFIACEPEAGPQISGVERIDVSHWLITRELDDCLPIVRNLSRLLGGGGAITGLMFRAEPARRALRSAAGLISNYVPAVLRETAAEWAKAGGQSDGGEVEAFANRLWTDENLLRFAKEMGYGVTAGEPEGADYLTSFTLHMPAATQSTHNHELVGS